MKTNKEIIDSVVQTCGDEASQEEVGHEALRLKDEEMMEFVDKIKKLIKNNTAYHEEEDSLFGLNDDIDELLEKYLGLTEGGENADN